MEYWESVAEKATRFFAQGEDVFAECGPGVVCFVAACGSESEAANTASIMESYREKLNGC